MSAILRGFFLFLAVLPLARAGQEPGVLFTVPPGQAVQVRTNRDVVLWRVGGRLYQEGPGIEGESFPVLVAPSSQALPSRRAGTLRTLGSAGGYQDVCPDQCAVASPAARMADRAAINITNGYHDEIQVELLLGQFETNFPSLARRLPIGGTHQGRTIWALKISDNVAQDEPEPRVVIDANIHAREYSTPEVALDLIWNLLTYYSNNPAFASWVNDLEIFVIPCLNPDGRYCCDHINSSWRKNGRDNNRNGTLTYPTDGVDLNRNSSFHWGSDNEGSSSDSSDDTFRGPSPASEPEIQAYEALIQRLRPAFTLSIHSYWGLYYGPYGDFNISMPDPDPFLNVGNAIARVSTNELNAAYTFVSGPDFEYTVNGDRSDANYGLHGIHAYGVELGSDYTGFQPSYATTRDKLVPGMRAGWQKFLAVAHTNSPKWRGYSRDTSGQNPVPARIRSLDMSRPNDESWTTRTDGWFECPVPAAGSCSFSVAPIGQEELTVTQTFQIASTATRHDMAFPFAPVITLCTPEGQMVWTNQYSRGLAVLETTASLLDPWLPTLSVAATGRTGTATLTLTGAFTFARAQIALREAADTNMAIVPGGAFLMGSGSTSESPPHTVCLDGFAMDRGEITKAQWDLVRGWAVSNGYSIASGQQGSLSNGAAAAATAHPVVKITWHDAVKWCNARSQQAGLLPVYYTNSQHTALYKTGAVNISASCVNWDANGYRLPTEAEWEKAARGGFTSRAYPLGNSLDGSYANYQGSGDPYDNGTTPARYYNGSQTPSGPDRANGYGLHDMPGNAAEWCWDWSGAYSNAVSTNPSGPASGTERIYRGGAWSSPPADLRCAWRGSMNPALSNTVIGLRCVRRLTP